MSSGRRRWGGEQLEIPNPVLVKVAEKKKKINVAAPPKLKIQNSRPTKFEQSFRCPERAYIMVIVGKLPIII